MTEPADLEDEINLKKVCDLLGSQYSFCGCWALIFFLCALCLFSSCAALMK